MATKTTAAATGGIGMAAGLALGLALASPPTPVAEAATAGRYCVTPTMEKAPAAGQVAVYVEVAPVAVAKAKGSRVVLQFVPAKDAIPGNRGACWHLRPWTSADSKTKADFVVVRYEP